LTYRLGPSFFGTAVGRRAAVRIYVWEGGRGRAWHQPARSEFLSEADARVSLLTKLAVRISVRIRYRQVSRSYLIFVTWRRFRYVTPIQRKSSSFLTVRVVSITTSF
jgi:hypothetical protein